MSYSRVLFCALVAAAVAAGCGGSGGGSLTRGSLPQSAGSPSPSASPSHSPSPAPSSTGPLAVLKHVLTADYCCGGYANETPAGGVASAQPWLTYFANPSANSDPTGTYPSYGAPGLAAAGVSPSRVYTYVDDSRIYRGDAQFNNIAPGGAQATAEAVDCFGNPITVNNQNGYLSDPWQLATLQIYDADVTQKFTASTEFGVVFLDDIGAYQFVDNNAVACENGIPWTGMSAAPAYAVIINGINVSGLGGHAPPAYLLNVLAPVLIEANGSSATLQAMITDFASLTNVVAMDCEGCLADNHNAEIGNSTPFDVANQWILAEDAEIVAVNAQKIFWLQDQDSTSTGAASYAGRIYAYASFMLTWDPVYTVYQNDYYGYPGDGMHPNSRTPQIHVFPEEGLVAYNPVVAYPSNASGIGALKDAGGTYFREYQNCYNQGTGIGACAFVVNPDSLSHPAPTMHGTYTHTMALNNQLDVLSGGTIATNGAAMPSTIPGLTGYVLLP